MDRVDEFVVALHERSMTMHQIHACTALPFAAIRTILRPYRQSHPRIRVRMVADPGTVVPMEESCARAWIESGIVTPVAPCEPSCGLPPHDAHAAALHDDSPLDREIAMAYYHWPPIVIDRDGTPLGFPEGNPTRSRHTHLRKPNGKIDRDRLPTHPYASGA